jgi:hypothetical protein
MNTLTCTFSRNSYVGKDGLRTTNENNYNSNGRSLTGNRKSRAVLASNSLHRLLLK